MKQNKNNRLTVTTAAVIAALGLAVPFALQADNSPTPSENPLIQTDVAKPAPPGQARQIRELPAQAQGNRGQQAGLVTGFIVQFSPERDPEVESKVRGNPSERGALMQERAAELSAKAGQSMRFQRAMGLPHHYVFQLDKQLSPGEVRETLQKLRGLDGVETVEENRLHTITAAPNDPGYSSQWHYYEPVGGMNAEGAWSQGITGQGAVVAVLDTGYRPHVDLAANILQGYDMISDPFIANDGDGRDPDARDPGDWVSAGQCGFNSPAQDQPSSWHGTHVAGTVAAVTNNGTGVAGVAYDAKVVPVRVLGRCGGTTADIADGILWAAGLSVPGAPANANPADVINLSLGGGGSCQSVTQSAINSARNAGSVIVVAAGNSNTNAANFTPASCNNVVTVAATNRDGGRAYYSNYGSVVDLAAPGGAMSYAGDPEGVLSTYNTGSTTPASDNYSFSQGTSMAAPHVAGVVALIRQANPSATPAEIEQIMVDTVRSFPASCSGCGAGIIDADAAVSLALGSGGGQSGGGAVDNLSAATGDWNRFYMEVPAGMTQLEVRISGGTGDADLYVRFGSQPTLNDWDCRPYRWGNDEVCTFQNPSAGNWYFGVHAYEAYSGVRLEATYSN
ncbi:S8 family serine peptidase [Aliidiomarina halalkaliphila]|uniref:S8 family serine peptidase n=1 Tax=Aliidiomarina halalkaliphila TaxID=2593535 RepID=A0A552WYZ2_9GAMM|nr:S8 family serine peptidase [Aliidiomarina halalkaliphila]TRW48051.1 S8 family serine peptidase [Aliidiomarina halalkaliphila]